MIYILATLILSLLACFGSYTDLIFVPHFVNVLAVFASIGTVIFCGVTLYFPWPISKLARALITVIQNSEWKQWEITGGDMVIYYKHESGLKIKFCSEHPGFYAEHQSQKIYGCSRLALKKAFRDLVTRSVYDKALEDARKVLDK